MAIINLDDLLPGMCVAEPVKVQGRVIVGVNVELTEKTIHLFKAWGVTEVNVKDDSIAEKEEKEKSIPANILVDIERNIKIEFKFFDIKDEISTEIIRIACKKRIDAWGKEKE